MAFFKNRNAFYLFFQIIFFFFEVFLFFFEVFFLNVTVILSVLTAFLRLIRVIANHEASINNSGNTFVTTIHVACDLNLTHVIVNLGTYQ